MNSVRKTAPERIFPRVPCCRCTQQSEQYWDRIATKSYCPSCEEDLVMGEADPLVEKVACNRCAVCGQVGTLCYQTFPLHSSSPVEIELCGEHLRALLARSLLPAAYHQLLRRLQAVGLEANDLFLLHEEFYDSQGQALKPAVEW